MCTSSQGDCGRCDAPQTLGVTVLSVVGPKPPGVILLNVVGPRPAGVTVPGVMLPYSLG